MLESNTEQDEAATLAGAGLSVPALALPTSSRHCVLCALYAPRPRKSRTIYLVGECTDVHLVGLLQSQKAFSKGFPSKKKTRQFDCVSNDKVFVW